MGAELIAWSFASGWASGVNAYAVVLVMGLFERFGHVAAIPDVLARTDGLVVSASCAGRSLSRCRFCLGTRNRSRRIHASCCSIFLNLGKSRADSYVMPTSCPYV